MVSFQKKEINITTTIGEKLKKKRQEKGLKLDELADELNIARNYLEAIEGGDFEKLPGEIYVKNFLRLYCNFLDLDYKQLFREYGQEERVHRQITKADIEAFGHEKVKKWYSFVTLNLLQKLILVLLVIAGLAFLGMKISNIVAPPSLNIISPEDNFITTNNYIEMVGQTEVGAKVSINGQNIMINPDGSFKEKIDLRSGLNFIKISAEKKYSKTVDVYKEVMVEK
jgi:transcriptional regulator with XRE-family HTH domain